MPQTPDCPTTAGVEKQPYRAPKVTELGPMSEIVQAGSQIPTQLDAPTTYSS